MRENVQIYIQFLFCFIIIAVLLKKTKHGDNQNSSDKYQLLKWITHESDIIFDTLNK